MLAADTINSNGLRSPSYSINSSRLHSPPRNSSSRRSISGSHSNSSGSHSNSSGSHSNSSGRHSSSSSDHQDILAAGDHRVFVSVAASPDNSMQNVDLYLPRR